MRVESFDWDGRYPKKRQWCLDRLSLKHDWVLFVHADEIVPPDLVGELAALDFAHCDAAGYFIKGRYVVDGQPLRYGLQNNKLCLFDRRHLEFPVVDDLDVPGMGEIEGHYQPVLKAGHEDARIGQIQTPLLHYALDDQVLWRVRHAGYATWEAAMIARGAYPVDPVPGRERLKRLFRRLPPVIRGAIAFLDSYIVKAGFLDGAVGWRLAQSRWAYYRIIRY